MLGPPETDPAVTNRIMNSHGVTELLYSKEYIDDGKKTGWVYNAAYSLSPTQTGGEGKVEGNKGDVPTSLSRL